MSFEAITLINRAEESAKKGRAQVLADSKAAEAAAVEAGNKEEAMAAYKAAVKRVDQTCAKGIIKKNAAARKKSQLTKKFNAM